MPPGCRDADASKNCLTILASKIVGISICFLNIHPKNLPIVGQFSYKISSTKGNFFPKIFRICSLKSLELRRFFDNLSWTKDEDEDGSSAKNLQRTKIFEALLQHSIRFRFKFATRSPLSIFSKFSNL